jgi:hypothetical protein
VPPILPPENGTNPISKTLCLFLEYEMKDKVQPNSNPNFKRVVTTLVDSHAGRKYTLAQVEERCSKPSPLMIKPGFIQNMY